MIEQTTITDELHFALRKGVAQSERLGKPIVVSVSERVSDFDPIEILECAAQLTTARAYWAQPAGELTLVSLGVARVVNPVESLRFRQAADGWRDLSAGAIVEGSRGLPGVGPLLLGGFAFDPHLPATIVWHNFPHTLLVLPKLLYTKTKNECWLTRNVIVDAETDCEFETLMLNTFESSVTELATNKKRAVVMSRNTMTERELLPAQDWKKIVADAIQTIRDEELEKVVLARAVQLEAPEIFDEARALRYFSKHAPGTYQFGIVREDDCFLGATPEQLVRVRAGKLETMGLAGSAPRGATPAQDEQFGNELLASVKDRNEQEIVVRAMREVLGDTCVQLQANATPTLLKLSMIQHLITRFNGTLAQGYSLLDLVERLHPTPAVGGRPRAAALQWIREHEKLDRGWYAGAVGWIDHNMDGEFVVAIRSALLHGTRATMFAGCGIVADSDPEREYAESNLKLKPMLAALGSPPNEFGV